MDTCSRDTRTFVLSRNAAPNGRLQALAYRGVAGRVRDFQRLLADPEVSGRLLHGSDFPLPAVPLAFAGITGLKQALALQAMTNLIEQDLALKETLGIGRTSAERAYVLICDTTRQ